MLNDEDLRQFIDGFYGYGNLASDMYFIGMEEGGGNSEKEISTRIDLWKELGQQEVVDLVPYNQQIGYEQFFTEKVTLQKTWSKLIKIILASKGCDEFSIDDIKQFQKDHLARLDSNHALIELMPLPSPSTNDWIYKDISTDSRLVTRKEYLENISPLRITKIKGFIKNYRPKVIIFYSYTYMNYWKLIAGTELQKIDNEDICYGASNKIHYVVIKHPVSFVKKSYFENVGKFIESLEIEL